MAADKTEDLKKLLPIIKKTMEKIDSLDATLADFSEGKSAAVEEAMRGLVVSLAEMEEMDSSDAAHFEIPLDILKAIDSGRNPAFVTNEFVIKTKQNNDLNKTKGDAIAALRDAMLTKASEIYPEESEAYKALRR